MLRLCLFILEDFTEELLSQHDAEIQRLKQHYEDHKELFDGVHQWEENWRHFQELEVSLDILTRLSLSIELLCRFEQFQFWVYLYKVV